MTHDQSVQDFIELGFSQLEAEVYVYLVQHPHSTGYKVAKGIGRANSLTYRTIDALSEKGAILIDDGQSRICRAVSPAELLEQMEQTWHQRKKRAVANIKSLEADVADERVYQLGTVDQVYERSRRMLADCETVALIDVFPAALKAIEPSIVEALGRGVKIVLQVYEPVDFPGAHVVVHRDADRFLSRWPGQWLITAVDGKEQLLAYIVDQGKTVQQAVWTPSPMMSWTIQSFAYSDVLLSSLIPMLEAGKSSEEVLKSYQSWLEHVPYPESPQG
jgi:HTH-type transcriptional regulator, sugar sensing transcriptional regulator